MSDDARDYTIAEWCAKRRLSRASFYNLLRANRGPRVIYPSPRAPRITAEADRAWEAERCTEAEAQRHQPQRPDESDGDVP